MRDKEQIKNVLLSQYDARDGTMPMDEMQWANNAGWIEALEFVLNEEVVEEQRDITHLLEGANNDTIKRAAERLSKEYGFGRKDDAIDSENDSVRDGWLLCTKGSPE